MIEVEGPDGSINEFPDGTADAVIAKAMKAQFGGPAVDGAPARAPTAPAGPSLGERASSALSRTASTIESYLGMGPRTASPSLQTSSDLDAQMRGQAPAPADPPKPPPTLGEQGGDFVRGALRTVDQGVRGIADGAVGLAGIPVDLMAGILNRDPDIARVKKALGLEGDIQRPFLGSDFNKGILNAANDATVDAVNSILPKRPDGSPLLAHPEQGPQDAFGRVAHRIGEEVGAAAVPVGFGVSAAKSLGEGVKELPALARLFAEPAHLNRAGFVAREAGNAAIAGTGAGVANEVTRAAGVNDHSGAHMAGDLAGALGALGVVGLGREVLGKANEVYQAVRGSENFRNKVTNEAAVGQLATEFGLEPLKVAGKSVVDTTPIVDAIERGRRVGDVIPGYRESLADRTGNPNVAAMEYAREAGGSTTLRANTEANTRAVDNALQAQAPQGSPGAFRSELESRRANLQQDATTDRQAAQARFEDAAQRLQSTMHADARGADIRAPLEDALEAARGVERGAWDGVASGSADIGPLVERFSGVRDGLSQAERQVFEPSHLTGIPGRFLPAEADAAAGAVVPIREAVGLRGTLTDAQRAAASAGEGKRAEVIGRYVDAVDSYFAEHHPNLEAYERARAVSRDLNDRFTRPTTDVAQILDRNQGQYRVPDSGVAGHVVRPNAGNQGGLDALIREAGTDPRARGALEDQVRSEVQGLRGPDQVDAYLRQHSRVFERFPELRQQVEQASGLRRTADAAAGRETELERSLGTAQQPGSSSVGRYLRYGDEASETAMRGVMNAPNPAEAMNELLDFAGNTPAAIDGARRTFWDILEKQSRRAGETTATIAGGSQPWMPRKLLRFLDEPRNDAVAQRLYRDDPEQLGRIRQIAETLQNVDLRASGRARNASGTPQGIRGAEAILSPETVTSRYYAMQRGQISPLFFATSILSVVARRSVVRAQSGAISKLVDEALVNPDFAAKLLKENNPANRAVFDRAVRSYLGGEAAEAVKGFDEDTGVTPEDPVKAAVARGRR